eukprot:2129808-Amphidinium_carterae.1
MMLHCEPDLPPYFGGAVLGGVLPSSVISWCVTSPACVVAVLAAEGLATEALPARSVTPLAAAGLATEALPARSVTPEGEPAWSLRDGAACTSPQSALGVDQISPSDSCLQGGVMEPSSGKSG